MRLCIEQDIFRYYMLCMIFYLLYFLHESNYEEHSDDLRKSKIFLTKD